MIPFDNAGNDFAVAQVGLGGGRTAICGERGDNTFVAELDAAGRLDKSFSQDGIAEIDHGGFSDRCDSLALDRAGGLVEASGVEIGPSGYFAVSRFEPDGTLDPVFGIRKFNPSGAGAAPLGMAIQADGRILVFGWGYVEYQMNSYRNDKTVVARLLPSGQPDESFAPGGVRLYSGPEGRAAALAGAIDRNGKLLLGGTSTVGETTTAFLARILTEPYAPPPATRPANRFKFAGFKLNKRKGTATLLIEVPGPGALALAGTKKVASGSKRRTKPANSASRSSCAGRQRKSSFRARH